MKKAMSVLLALCLLLGLGACGKPAGGSGLLSKEQIARYESLYLKDNDQMLSGLGLDEGEIASPEFGRIFLRESKTIAGREFQTALLISEFDPTGLYGVSDYLMPGEGPDENEVIKALYAQAVELYGEPDMEDIVSENLKDIEERNSLRIAWTVGQLSEFTIQLLRLEEPVYLEVSYRIQSIVDGRKLTVEEMLERVLEAQKD